MSAQPQTAVYVYGIVPGDVELVAGARGVGDPSSEIRLVRHRDLAALVSDVDMSTPLGRPDDFVAHEELLDSSSAGVPVLPLRFGSVMTDDDAVASELLDANHDEFHKALAELDGRAEYIVRGRYVERAILREILAENDAAARLSEQLRDVGEDDATRDIRMQLGELIAVALAGKRERDTAAVIEALREYAADAVAREPTHEFDAVCAAFLVEVANARQLEEAVERLARDADGRIDFRLTGPLAAYDFVVTASPSSGG
jgi:hypothetical protein